jgi:hypothetical protein
MATANTTITWPRRNLVGVTTISCVNQEWRKSRKLEIAFIYALAAICTRYLQIDWRMLTAAHLDERLRLFRPPLPNAGDHWWPAGLIPSSTSSADCTLKLEGSIFAISAVTVAAYFPT